MRQSLFAPVTKGKRGQGGLTGIVATLIVIAVMLFIAVKINAEVGSSIERGSFTAAENTTYDNISSTTLGSFDLVTVALIDLAASGILAIVFTLTRT